MLEGLGHSCGTHVAVGHCTPARGQSLAQVLRDSSEQTELLSGSFSSHQE